MFGKSYGWESYDRESFPTETNTNTSFCRRVLLSHFRSVRKGNTKLTSLLYFIRPSLMDTQTIDKANNITVPFFFISKYCDWTSCMYYVVNIASRRESHVIIWHSYLFTISRPSLVWNVESNVIDMTNLRYEVEREPVLEITNTSGDNTLINWDP